MRRVSWLIPVTFILHFVHQDSSQEIIGQNIALWKPAWQYPGTLNENLTKAENAVDGKTSPSYGDGSCTHTYDQSNVSAYWTVDLGVPYYISIVKIYNRDIERQRLRQFRLYGYPGNVTLYDDANQTHPQYNNSIIYVTIDSVHPYRNITVYLPTVVGQKTILTLCEVKIFREYNIAFKKPAWQHPGAHDSNFADNAVDGNTRSSYNDRSCSHTSEQSEEPAYWTVDLGDLYYIAAVKIYNRDSERQRLRQFRLYGYPGNVTLYDDANQTHPQYNNPIIYVTIDSVQPYRNITVYLPTVEGEKTILTLCEVEIYGGCLLPSIPNGNFSSETGLNNVVPSGIQMDVNCSIGHKLENESTHFMCTTDGQSYTWNNPVPVCTTIMCTPPTLDYGNYTYSHNQGYFEYGDVATPKCFKGFELEGTGQRTCQENETWSGGDPLCTIITCEHPGEFDNGYYMQNSTNMYVNGSMDYNSTTQSFCKKGFKLNSNQSSQRICSEHGNWTGVTPRCDPVSCDDGTWDGVAPKCSIPTEGTERQKGPPIVLIAGVPGVVVAVVLVTLIAFILVRKRRASRNKRDESSISYKRGISEATSDAPSTQLSEFSNSGCISDTEEQEYYNSTTKKTLPENAIAMENLTDAVFTGRLVTNGFEEQFQSLPKGLTKSHNVASKSENKPRNRYRNLYPYDDDLVILEGSTISDNNYINASYVNGFNKERAYIATQGPMKNTLNDFWEMVWQTDCRKIVMLTNLKEQEKIKCEQYWPDSGSQIFGDVTVRMVDEEIFSEYVVRTLALYKEEGEERFVTLFHFTTWPDKGVPRYASSLVHFRNKVKHSESNAQGPTAVHCSAGVGRTGTYIALDYLIDQAQTLGYVTVVDCVRALRTQRINLVQTLDQYIFVHHALVEALMLSTSALPAAKFPDAYRELLQTDPLTKKRNLTLAFEMLRKMSPVHDEFQYINAKDIANRNKNRYSNILPVAEYMPTLSGTGQQETDYINAVYLSSYKEKKAFIVTQLPLEATIPDFWRLVYEHNVHTIVMLNHVSQVQKTDIYWPEDEKTLVYGYNTIKHLGNESLGSHRAIRLELLSPYETRTIKQFQCGGWKPDSTVPDDPSTILLLLEIVQAWQQQTGNHPILVHCMNGAERSGLYCVISAVLERMKIEQDVAISQVIEEMRNCREQIISSEVQFQFCHEAVIAFCEQHDTYSNFSA